MASDWSPRLSGALALGVVSFAFAPILVRAAGDVPALAIAVWRTGIAVAVLGPPALVRIGPEVRRFTRRDVALILAAGVCLGLHFIAWIESLSHTSVASASVLVTTSPLLLAVLGVLVLGERLRRATVGAIGLSVAGAALIGWADAGSVTLGRGALWGNSLALAGAVLVSVYLLIGRVVRKKVSWLAYVTPLYTAAALTALAAALWTGVPLLGYSWSVYALCAGLALGPQVLGHGSFNYALQHLPAAVVGLLALLEPVGASVLAYALFGEVPPLTSIVGMGAVMAGVAGVVWRRNTAPAEEHTLAEKRTTEP
jgi:drug/metabolite transporter (DMT)-like permease